MTIRKHFFSRLLFLEIRFFGKNFYFATNKWTSVHFLISKNKKWKKVYLLGQTLRARYTPIQVYVAAVNSNNLFLLYCALYNIAYLQCHDETWNELACYKWIRPFHSGSSKQGPFIYDILFKVISTRLFEYKLNSYIIGKLRY